MRRPDEVLRMLPESCAITDCKSLSDALEKNESLGLGLSEKRTSIEVTATRQQMRATGIQTRWVNSDRQLADVLTKPTAPPAAIAIIANWQMENLMGRQLYVCKEPTKGKKGTTF